MYIKIHEAYRKIVALVDSDLIGKTFEEGIKQIKINPHFFQGEEKTKEEILEILIDLNREDATFNIVGKEAIQTAIEAEVIKPEGVFTIQEIPIALGLL